MFSILHIFFESHNVPFNSYILNVYAKNCAGLSLTGVDRAKDRFLK